MEPVSSYASRSSSNGQLGAEVACGGLGGRAVDYDLHGVARVRLVDASPRDVAAVTRQLGPIRSETTVEPDIVVRFVERLQLGGSMRYVGHRDAGFTDDGFFLLRGPHKSHVKVRIPLDRGGNGCEVVCESGLPAVPLLIPLINLTALSKDVLPVHAAAFVHRGTGVLMTGWAKGGKTETLLAFMANGARYVGDEWVYVTRDGTRLFGIPEPIKLWDWHLAEVPSYAALVGRGTRRRLHALGRAEAAARLAGRALGGTTGRLLGRATHLLESQRYTHLHPEQLFGRDRCDLQGPFDKVLFGLSAETDDVSVRPLDGREIARRMVFSLEYERLDLRAAYLKLRFAFPDASNTLIEESEQLQRDLLVRALADKEGYVVHHPFPAPIPRLFDAIAPFV